LDTTLPSRYLRWNLLVTDLGFVLYWSVSALNLLPADWLYKDHENPILHAWNWSFSPLDLAASFSGLAALRFAARTSPKWQKLALISATLTFCAGLMAISFWFLRRDFDPAWWAPNIYLMLWPVTVLRELLSRSSSCPLQIGVTEANQ